MATIEVSYKRRGEDGTVLQEAMELFDMNDPEICNEIGAVFTIKYDKQLDKVDGVGGRPRNRPNPAE